MSHAISVKAIPTAATPDAHAMSETQLRIEALIELEKLRLFVEAHNFDVDVGKIADFVITRKAPKRALFARLLGGK